MFQDRLSTPLISHFRTVPLKPLNVTVDNDSVTSNSFRVMWQAPKEMSEFDAYQVMIESDSAPLFGWPSRHLPRNKNPLNSIEFNEDLLPGRTYKVTVKTVSGKVTSWPAIVEVTTKPLPVKNLYLSAKTGAVTAFWAPDETSVQNEYKVNYHEVSNGDSSTEHSVSVYTNKTNYVLDLLLPLRKYSLTVQAVSNHVESNRSTLFVVTLPSKEWY